MRLLRRRTGPDPNAGFDWREIACADEATAKAEAEREQNLDNADEAEWIYLKSDKTGDWLARRTPRHMKLPKSRWDPEAWWWVQWPD